MLSTDACEIVPEREKRRALQILTSRLDFVDIAILGKLNDDPNGMVQLKERLGDLSVSVSRVEKEIPQIGLCRELIVKLKPHLSRSRSSLTQTMERLDAALTLKTELEDIVKMLVTIENTTKSRDIFASVEIATYQDEIRRVESVLKTLLQLSGEQSEEVDGFLSIYENTVIVFSSYSDCSVCVKISSMLIFIILFLTSSDGNTL